MDACSYTVQKYLSPWIISIPETPMALLHKLIEIGLSQRWVDILKRELSIQTIKGLEYIGIEHYPLLLQFVSEPKEKYILKQLLKTNGSDRFQLIQRLKKKLNELHNCLVKLNQLQACKQPRHESDVKEIEMHCLEMFQVPASMWFESSASLSYVTQNIENMLKTIDAAINDGDYTSSLLLQTSGGIICTSKKNKSILKAIDIVELDWPLLSEFTEEVFFTSREEEESFFQERLGFSVSTEAFLEPKSLNKSTSYCSTVKYWFVPQASCYYDNKHLKLSSDALFHLTKIDEAITGGKSIDSIENDCKTFLKMFGIHSFKGPIHLGGIFLLKCTTSGHRVSLTTAQLIKQFHKEVIDAHLHMCFPPGSSVTSLSEIHTLSGDPDLKNITHIQVFTVGGPQKSFGFPDWRNGLAASNKSWKIINFCGSPQVPVWDIIGSNNKSDFKNFDKLAFEITKAYLAEDLKLFVKSLIVEEPLAHKLQSIVTKRREVEKKELDPFLWSVAFLPHMPKFLCSILDKCSQPEMLHTLMCIIEPLDLGYIDLSPFRSVLTKLYDVEKNIPQLKCKDFINCCRYFELAQKIMQPSHNALHQKQIAKGTLLVEKVVLLLRTHLAKTNQCYEECLLLTLLFPLNYIPKRNRFCNFLTKDDIQCLYSNFQTFCKPFFEMGEVQNLQIQSYLLYLTVHLGIGQEYVQSNIQFLQEKIEFLPEIKFLLRMTRNWEWLKSQMKGLQASTFNTQALKRYTEHAKMVYTLFNELGLLSFFPQKISTNDAIKIREDTINVEITPNLYPWITLQKIMSFDSRCRMKISIPCEGEKSINPLDGLLAIIHCSDNFLRQSIFSRLATCQIAVPLLLPDPHSRDPTLLLWAMRSIIKEFKLSDNTTFTGDIINYPANIVSVLRIGDRYLSKPDILNETINTKAFLGYRSPGGTKKQFIVKGLVDISWYLPGNGLFENPVAFMNLHGDAGDVQLQKQFNFICDIATVHVILLSTNLLQEDATRQHTLCLLRELSRAPQGLICIYNDISLKRDIEQCLDAGTLESKICFIECEVVTDDFASDLREELKKKLGAQSKVSFQAAAHKYSISLDESDVECTKGRKLMEEIYGAIDSYRKQTSECSLRSFLPLQSKGFWHCWAALDKEQFRQRNKHKCTDSFPQELSITKYAESKRKSMKDIRSKQYECAKQSGTVMDSFLNVLKTQSKTILKYYLMWLKLKLDDLSRDVIPDISSRIEVEQACLQTSQEKVKERHMKKLKELKQWLNNSSLGLEHLLREVGQMYEAFAANEDVKNSNCKVKYVPHIVAHLLHDGLPLELLDGDASHMPQIWVSAVLNSLAELLRRKYDYDPNIYVLSVLGITSSGKSTLLNTVFGIQFSVSAGRCTRGAFMQLIPVHFSLQEKMRVQYFLVVDTEGVRATELDRLTAVEHDNELATFVIGMANLALINIKGEITGEMDDILNAAVHAFLRMSRVELKPCCHIVYHNVAAVGAKEKLMEARSMTIEKLDKMTRAAAKETGLETKYNCFSDVIQFDHKQDVSEFDGLWDGRLPMAGINNGYSEKAQQLKGDIIALQTKTEKYKNSSVSVFVYHLENLWNAILQEDFAFTFQNTFELVAYKTLEVKYNELACSLTKEIGRLQFSVENELFGCLQLELEDKKQKCKENLSEEAQNEYRVCQTGMEIFFEKGDKIMMKWQNGIMLKLKHLYEKLFYDVEQIINQTYQARKERAEAENDKEALSNMIQQRVHKLVRDLGEKKLTKNELMEVFDDTWKKWMETLNLKAISLPDTANEVEQCILSRYNVHHRLFAIKLGNEQLKELQVALQMEIKPEHIQFSHKNPIKQALQMVPQRVPQIVPLMGSKPKLAGYIPARTHTCETFKIVKGYLENLKHSGRNYCPQVVHDLLDIVHNRRYLEGKYDFQFTDQYEVDVALISCSCAIPVFEEMADNFRTKHDPTIYVECELKPNFTKMFMDMYDKVEYENIAARRLCCELKEPIRKLVFKNLTSEILENIQDHYPWMKHKQSFIGKVLLEIGKKLNQQSDDSLGLCMDFISDVKKSLKFWAKFFIESYCHSGSPSLLSTMARDQLTNIVAFVTAEAANVSDSLSTLETVTIGQWVAKFHSAVKSKIRLSLVELTVYFKDQELTNLNFFKQQVIERLEELLNILMNESFERITYSDISREKSAPHQQIYKQVAGCTEQCPFCGAQCEKVIKDHCPLTKHTTHHRPQCLNKFKWIENNTSILDICTHLVATNANFRNKDSRNLHPYTKYNDFYPKWNIPADKKFKVSLYWKWFLGHYYLEIKEKYGHEETEIPQEWKELQWVEVEQWLKTEYQI